MMHLTRRWSTWVALFAVGMLVLSACSKPQQPAQPSGGQSAAPAPVPAPKPAGPKAGGKITVGISADVQRLDPHVSYVVVDRYVTENVYEGLVALDEKMDPVPGLAEKWTQVDPLNYEFTLRQGVKFHNGRSVTAEDVVWSFNRVRNPQLASRWASEYKPVESATAKDANTVVFKLKSPYGPFVASMAALKIAPKEAEADLAKKAVGTGPFMFVEWVPNEYLKLKKNPDYWNKAAAPPLDEITLKPITEAETRLVALQTGTVDMIDAIPFKDVDRVKGDSKLQVFTAQGTTTYDYLAMNVKRPLLANKKVRQVISQAMDKQSVSDVIMYKHATPSLVPLPPQHWAFTQLPGYSFDVAKAKATMIEAGYPNGFELSITVSPSFPEQVKMAEMLQSNLAKAGVKLNVESMEWAAWLDKVVQKRDYDMFISYSSPVGWDPDAFFYYLYRTNEPLNINHYSNTTVDGLMEKAQQSTSRDERKTLYKQIMEILVDEVPRVIIQHREINMGAQKWVQGFKLNERGDIRLRTVWLDK